MSPETIPAIDLAAILNELKAIRETLTNPPPPVSLVVSADDGAKLIGVSRAGFYRLAAGLDPAFPASIEIAGIGRRWRRCDLEKWAERLRPSRRKPRPVEVA